VNIRTSLVFWFLVAAIVPAAVISLFVANDASARFYSQAREELKEAVNRGQLRYQDLKQGVKETIESITISPAFTEYLTQISTEGSPLIEVNLARTLAEEHPGQLDFLKILDENGTVVSSLEWRVFAGKGDLEWGGLSTRQSEDFIVGPARTEHGDELAIRYLMKVENLHVVGGVNLGVEDLNRFGAAKDIVICLIDGVAGELHASKDIPGINLEQLIQLNDEGSKDQIRIADRRYLLEVFHLDSRDQQAGAIVFLSSTLPLNSEIESLWRSFMITAAAGVILATLLGVIISATVSKPLKSLLYAFDLVSLGDFNHRLKTKRRDELGDILRSFNRTTENLQSLQNQLIHSERVAAWQEIARKIAHEIKNPLSPIQISIETMQKVHERKHPEFDRIFSESTHTMLEEVEKIRAIVQEFSDFARMPEPHFEVICIADSIQHIVNLYRNLDDQVEWDVSLPEKLPDIFADEKQLQQALINIVKNALEAMPDGGKLALQVNYLSPMIASKRGARRPGKLEIRIRDTGTGMTAEDKARVFTPYFTTKDRGTGLGLVIVQKIIELHRGQLRLESEPDQGTLVTIVLPEHVG